MTKQDLESRLITSAIERALLSKGYAFFKTGEYNLNIIGIRADCNREVTNKFDDFMVVLYGANGTYLKKIYSITTEPGRYYMKNLCNSKGAAILVPGQYRGCWQIGKHNGKYEALVQCRPVSVYRDNNKDNLYDLKNIDKGLFGINIHRSTASGTSVNIDNWSAGCQVFASSSDFYDFLNLCKEQKKRYGNSFTYTLLDEKDIL